MLQCIAKNAFEVISSIEDKKNKTKQHPYRGYESHFVAFQQPLAVQLRAKDAEDHHLHGICHLKFQTQCLFTCAIQPSLNVSSTRLQFPRNQNGDDQI